MYSNKENVNILTSLLVAHGVRHVVVCPGSRNAPIVHNLSECADIKCHPVTDERSAGFYALG
ncbi:MAG: 2-succinyl-5-enolpyruvyl-6-hydroxy-3-cyclohexene-1-carboxylic-acid synthase, partial [Prevotella sp.]|nr:2-succinyl-5-enolpyruvyl-6-hydroxy-3-cyclohexene-1-carboxylic-acid synthase [Prevotella sp.]